MKNFKAGIPHAKKGLLYFLIIGICCPHLSLQSKFGNSDGLIMALTGGLGVAAAWAIYERIGKQNAENVINALQYKIETYNSEDRKKQYLTKIQDSISAWNEFLDETYIGTHQESEEVFVEKMIGCILQQLQKYNRHVDSFHTKIKEGITDLLNKSNELLVHKNTWEESSSFVALANKVGENLTIALNKLKQYDALLEKQKNYIKLLSFLDNGIEKEYGKEIEYAINAANSSTEVIDQIIRTKNNQVLFPYLFYSQELQVSINEFKKHLNNLTHFNAHPFQVQHIERAQYLYGMLFSILTYVSNSEALMQEKETKIEHDRKEEYVKRDIAERKEMLRLETKERESKIAQQKAIAEAKVLEQKNKQKNLANEKAKLDVQKKELEQREKDNALQLARIHEGHGIKKALDENDRKWRADYNSLQATYSSLQAKHHQLSTANTNTDAELKRLRIQVSSLESDIKATHSNHASLERYARSLELKISNVAQALDALRQKVSTPPINPHSVDGLADYLNNLQRQIQHLKTIVA